MAILSIPHRSPPSYTFGYARSAGESANPGLWRELAGAWVPALGPTGITVYNAAALPFHGLQVNGPTWHAGIPGSVLRFNGSSTYVTLGDIGAAEQINFTYVAHINTTQTGNDKWWVAEGSTSTNTPLGGLINNDNVARFMIRNDGATNDNIVGTTTINDGVWHTIAAIRRMGGMELYVDGDLEATGTAPGTPISLNTATLAALHRTAIGQYCSGDLAVAYIYRRALTPSEIQVLHFDPFTPFRRKSHLWAFDTGGGPPATRPQGPLGHPLAGALGGPI